MQKQRINMLEKHFNNINETNKEKTMLVVLLTFKMFSRSGKKCLTHRYLSLFLNYFLIQFMSIAGLEPSTSMIDDNTG